MNETLSALMQQVFPGQEASESLTALSEHHTKALRDLRVNVSNVLQYASLSEKERWLLALAMNDGHAHAQSAFRAHAISAGATEEELAETIACVALLRVNNVFYRFRHFTHKEYYEKTQAGIKMSIMIQPVLGKEFFELMSLAVSALNGCEMCVVSHEASLMSMGTPEQRVYEAVRLVAVIRGLLTVA